MRYYLSNVYVKRAALVALTDLACFVAAATVIWITAGRDFGALPFLAGAGIAWTIVFVGLYYCDSYGLLVLGSGRRTLHCVFATMGMLAGVFGLTYFLVPLPESALPTAAHGAALFFPLLLGGRLVARLLLSRWGDRVLVVGTSDLGRAIARAVQERQNLGTSIVGFLSDDLDDQGHVIEGVPVVGRPHELEKLLSPENHIHRVVVASKRRDEHFPADILFWAKLRGVRVESGVSFYERITGRVYMRDLRSSYLIFSDGFRVGPVGRAVKRAVDAVGAAVGLLVAAPMLGLAALAIKLDSPGPVFFRQEREGSMGRPIRLLKLRTMRDDAERDTGAIWARTDDDRITRVGRLLRKTRLDEVPQLWNVLLGDMSLVGPRPERPELAVGLVERYPYFRARNAVKPGITGWAQIRHGYVSDAEDWEEKLALDLYYLKYRSPLMDLLVLWTTVKTVVLLKGH